MKADQRYGKLTEGIVKDILTSSSFYPHGIKVSLKSDQVGRVKETISYDLPTICNEIAFVVLHPYYR